MDLVAKFDLAVDEADDFLTREGLRFLMIVMHFFVFNFWYPSTWSQLSIAAVNCRSIISESFDLYVLYNNDFKIFGTIYYFV